MMFILYVAKLAQWPLRASLSGSTAPQPSVDPRPLVLPAHNTAAQVEGKLRVEQGAGRDGHGRLLRRPDSDNPGLQNLTLDKPLRVHLDKLSDGSPSGTTHPSAERFLCCVFDEFVPLGCKAFSPIRHARSFSDACCRRRRTAPNALRLDRLHISRFASVTLRPCLGALGGAHARPRPSTVRTATSGGAWSAAGSGSGRHPAGDRARPLPRRVCLVWHRPSPS